MMPQRRPAMRNNPIAPYAYRERRFSSFRFVFELKLLRVHSFRFNLISTTHNRNKNDRFEPQWFEFKCDFGVIYQIAVWHPTVRPSKQITRWSDCLGWYRFKYICVMILVIYYMDIVENPYLEFSFEPRWNIGDSIASQTAVIIGGKKTIRQFHHIINSMVF